MGFLPERNAWRVKRRHRQLIYTLHFIYTVFTEEDPPLVLVQQASRMLENIEHWYPVGRKMSKAIAGSLWFKKEDVGRN